MTVKTGTTGEKSPALARFADGSPLADPTANSQPSQATLTYCYGDPSGADCTSSALADIDAARSGEGVGAMVLPADFSSLSVPEQLLVVSNLERVDRGLAPITGLSAGLDANAQQGAADDADPFASPFYGKEWASNWAGGYASSLVADFFWMYDDGPGSFNIDCQSAGDPGCWGHRNNILASFSTPIMMGAAIASPTPDGPSLTELFVGGDTETGPGEPDAPIFEPPTGTTTTTTTTSATTTSATTTSTTTTTVAPTTSSAPVTSQSTTTTSSTTSRPTTTSPPPSTPLSTSTSVPTAGPPSPIVIATPPLPATTSTSRPVTTTTSVAGPGSSTTVPHFRPVVSVLTAEGAVSGSTALLDLRCARAACRGTIELVHHKVPLGSHGYYLRAGRERVFALDLDSHAIKLLGRSKHGAISVTELVSVKGGKTVEKKIELVPLKPTLARLSPR
ncbi:MAG: hypothetical protein ABSE77_11555 [Acidimicrobiales bacterium]